MKKFFETVGYNAKMLLWAIKLHFYRWNQYRGNVITWVLTIWLTIAVQIFFIYTIFKINNEELFGYSGNELMIFLGMALFAAGLAQSIIHGIILHLSRCVWTGQFDFWLVQKPNLIIRVMLEDLGIIWFLPHLIIGPLILFFSLPLGKIFYALVLSSISAFIEIGMTIIISIPSLKWGKWDPNEGLWEYFETARSAPILKIKNPLLLFISFGVLQYSLAIATFNGDLSFFLLCLISLIINSLALFLFKILEYSYSSASS
jgi:ABC-type uncharacterized transport system permease subunit